MFIVATLSAIIASQALISAVFQIISQAISQSFFPRFQQTHTNPEVRPLHPSLCQCRACNALV
jgi:K+ transporter